MVNSGSPILSVGPCGCFKGEGGIPTPSEVQGVEGKGGGLAHIERTYRAVLQKDKTSF